ncbi:alpha/beta hydrolase-fold protein [Planctomicrobium sp. SH664]|uniref:alpha/beta hydrolase-fold protein n=1 Tax=Planctomicrobium sp. SH664 TaxID=3448125 RepID=UPI003F5B884E
MRIAPLILPAILLLSAPAFGQTIKSVKDAYDVLHASTPLSAEGAAELQKFVEAKYKSEDLTKGNHKHLQQKADDGGGYGFLCLRAPQARQVSVAGDRGYLVPMTRLPGTDLWVWAEKFAENTGIHYRYDVDGRRFVGGRAPRMGFENYPLGPDGLEQPGVPKGQILEMGVFSSQKHFPGTERKWWIYIPAQYNPAAKKQASLMVVNDGGGFYKGEGSVSTVLDNLIHQRKIPVTIAVFIDPGVFPAKEAGKDPVSNRSNEYDTCTPRYANFLDEEILPIVRDRFPHSSNPWDHAIMGSSSGASCAFTAAWHRNDLFRRVISFVGSYCDFRPLNSYPEYGGALKLDKDDYGPWKTAHDYPALIRKTNPRKEIRVFLQDGENDVNNTLGNWWLANQQMASALSFAGYDYRFATSTGVHSKRHGMSIFPEIMTWVWSNEHSVGEN